MECTSFPDRRSIIANHPNAGIAARTIGTGKSFLFMPTSVYDRDHGDTYQVILFGVATDGSKVGIIINDIKPSFVVKATMHDIALFYAQFNGKDNEIPYTITKDGVEKNYVKKIRIEFKYRQLYGKSFESYQSKESEFVEIICNTLEMRRTLIKFMTDKNYHTYQDDANHLNKVCREYPLSYANWLFVRSYTQSTITNNCQYMIETSSINIADIDLIKDLAADINKRTSNKPTKYLLYDEYVAGKIVQPPKLPEHMIQMWGDKNITDIATAINKKREQLAKDPTLVMTWDIETYGRETGGEPPQPEHPSHVMFMLCLTVHYHYDNTPLLKLCISHSPIIQKNPPRYTVIKTDDEAGTIKAFCEVFRAISPEYLIGFNDSNYDAKWLVERAKTYGFMPKIAQCFNAIKLPPYALKTDATICKNMYKPVDIKLEADSKLTTCPLQGIGFISVDVCTEYRKIYKKTDKWSLNFFLAENKMELKVDMPYQKMFDVYAEGNAVAMEEVGHYCWWDAYCCQALFNKRHIIPAKRALAQLSMVTTKDAFYKADGSKVLNCLMYEYTRRRIYCSNKNSESDDYEKYPGAYVVPPHKGLDAEYPVTALDFSSLYPSLIMAYNLSPEWLLTSIDERDRAVAEGHNIHKIDFKYAESGRQIVAWTIRHDNKPEKMGVYGYILEELFNKRVGIKDELALCKTAVENLEFLLAGKIDLQHILTKEPPNEIVDELFGISNRTVAGRNADNKPIEWHATTTISQEYINNDTSFRARMEEIIARTKYRSALVDLSQLALKILMNTFYGKTGDRTSSFYRPEIAGGITSAGQQNIRFVRRIVEGEGCYVKYGDTDSLYLQFNPAIYATALDEYQKADHNAAAMNGGILDTETAKANKLAYCTRLVEIAFVEIERLKKLVNEALFADNGTKYLKMAYEEVLFPSWFLGKKKYLGIPHVNKVDFFPKSPFIKGIEVTKRGNTKLLNIIGDRIIKDALSIYNKLSVEEIVTKHFVSLFTEQWGIEYFEASKTYKPKKKNVSVLRFVSRMQEKAALEDVERKQGKYLIDDRVPDEEGNIPPEPERLYTIPSAGDKVKVVVCQNNDWYELNGNKKEPSVGDRYEYADVYKRLLKTDKPLAIDLKYYAEGAIIGMCARFITNLFEPPERIEDENIYKDTDEKSFKAAKKYLKGIASKYYTGGYSKETAANYRSLYKRAKDVISHKYSNIDLAAMNQLETLSKFDSVKMEEALYSAVTLKTTKSIDIAVNTYIHVCGSLDNANEYFGGGRIATQIEQSRNAFIQAEITALIDSIKHRVVKIKEINEAVAHELEETVMAYRNGTIVNEMPAFEDSDMAKISERFNTIIKLLRMKIYSDIMKRELIRRISERSGIIMQPKIPKNDHMNGIDPTVPGLLDL